MDTLLVVKQRLSDFILQFESFISGNLLDNELKTANKWLSMLRSIKEPADINLPEVYQKSVLEYNREERTYSVLVNKMISGASGFMYSKIYEIN